MTPELFQNARYDLVPVEIRKRFEQIKNTRRGMYIHGKVGCGKTWIAHAMKRFWATGGGNVIFWNTTKLIHELKSDFGKKPEDRERPEDVILRFRGLLFLDDIGAEKVTDYVADIFYLIVNHRYENKLPIIFTSNLPISELAEKVGDRIASRIVGMCDVAEVVGNDRRMASVRKFQARI